MYLYVYIEYVRDIYGMYIVHMKPPAKDLKAKNDACQQVWFAQQSRQPKYTRM